MANANKIMLLLLLVISLKGYPQKISYMDLAGTWNISGTSRNPLPFSIKFISSSSFVFDIMGLSMGNCSYIVNTSCADAIMRWKGVNELGLKVKDVWVIKRVGLDTLKIQSKEMFHPITSDNENSAAANLEWDAKETVQNTGILTRRKV